ncbi:hypothetical protein, partial [Aeromonas rivipollensis]|uniref:hypothetical protein n=1 Tax=Aeromonas rivipollensis TaxID=948519 RepID=UPI003D002E8A
MKGYIVTFSDETSIEVIPDEGGMCKFSVDDTEVSIAKEGANKRGNSSRLTQSFHFFMFEP